jgi:hypothetical protein
MRDVFEPLTRDERRGFRERYLAELRGRDGEADVKARKLALREELFREIQATPIRLSGPPVVDQAVFSRNERLRDPEPGLDERTLWALAVAKTNRSERFGVEYAMARKGDRAFPPDDPRTYINLEEVYHTRILRDVVETIGLEMHMQPPHRITRWAIQIMARLPHAISYMLIFDGELAGVAMFRLLCGKARELFADQPEPLRRIESLFQQILTDEIGHVRYAHSTLGRVRLAIARLMLRPLVRSLISDVPEFERLFGRARVMEEIWRADLSPLPRLLAATP